MGFATAALLTGIAGTGLTAYGQYRAGQDAANAEEYNASIALKEAEIAKVKGKLDVDRQRKFARRFQAEQTVAIAKSGIAFQGSAFEVFKDSAEELELDALILEYNSAIEQSRAIDEADVRRASAKRIRSAGILGAATTVLTQSASFLAAQGKKD